MTDPPPLPPPRRCIVRSVALQFGSTSTSFSQAPDLRKALRETCSGTSSNLRELDGVRIPARLLSKAKGVAVVTVARGGVWVGGEVGTGLVVRRLEDGGWSAPSAIGLVGFSFGALIGVAVTDHVFLLMSDKAVSLLSTSTGSINLGADIAVAVGPAGRSVEADVGVTDGGRDEPSAAPIYTYSNTKGLYAGVSFDGKVIVTRHDVNEKFYGMQVEPSALLSGEVPAPPAAEPLYESLRRCSVHSRNMFGEEFDPAMGSGGEVEGEGVGEPGGVVLQGMGGEEKKVDFSEKPTMAMGVGPIVPQPLAPAPALAPAPVAPPVSNAKTFNGDWPF